ncbi:CASP-like protein 2A1 [Nicotiana tabacum]|uniref:CASP-like protein n=1 Tax=Nicotiana tabacum TaxID=4097 RepID=A0A1S4AGC4_TOBAC|nr:CASP-like protein 2A1 [Nicotiana tomentosiformis]XP_016475755.1 PREDICTED: CASP-like protein 2A1 isoform X1 [Nicotiana tabacum]
MEDSRQKMAGSTPLQKGSGEFEDENGSSSMRTAETVLRLLPMGLCVVALVIMLKNSQTNDFGSLSYSDLGTFRYLVHANGICAGYSLLSAIVAAVPRPITMSRAWTFFLLDQILTYIILAAGAASTEVVYLAYKGDTAVTWSESCGSFGGFCHKATASVSVTFIVSLCYAGLSLLSSYRLFSKYDAPVELYNNKGSIEIATY